MNSEINFQPRDIELLTSLFESRLMTARHITDLYFQGKSEAAKKRLQKLKSTGMISEKRRRCYEPSILFLSVKGYRFLKENGNFSDYPKDALTGFKRRTTISEITLKHELSVLDTKVAFHNAVKKSKNLNLAECSTWPLLHQFQVREKNSASKILIKPDGFIRIHETNPEGHVSEYTFFLEVDRGSEKLETLVQKAVCYNRFYREGGMAERHGKAKEAYKDFPFRVLFVVKSQQRQINLAKMLLETDPPILTQVLITTFQELETDPLGEIWVQPISLKKQTGATPEKCSPL